MGNPKTKRDTEEKRHWDEMKEGVVKEQKSGQEQYKA